MVDGNDDQMTMPVPNKNGQSNASIQQNSMMTEILEEVLSSPSLASNASVLPKLADDEFIVGSLSVDGKGAQMTTMGNGTQY